MKIILLSAFFWIFCGQQAHAWKCTAKCEKSMITSVDQISTLGNTDNRIKDFFAYCNDVLNGQIRGPGRAGSQCAKVYRCFKKTTGQFNTSSGDNNYSNAKQAIRDNCAEGNFRDNDCGEYQLNHVSGAINCTEL